MSTTGSTAPRDLSLWHATLPSDDVLGDRAPLQGNVDVDVAIVGAGFTGLWTAYELARADPTLRIIVVESEFAGFGASGRNGGWCSALLPMSFAAMTHTHDRDAAVRMQRAMHDTVDEIGRVAAAEGIDCHWRKGGTVQLVRNPAQETRVRAEVEDMRAQGFGEDDYRYLGAAEARAMVGATDVHGGSFTPHCAAIHPARLARGLASTVERLGVTIVEHTRVLDIRPGRLTTTHGVVRAASILRSTEAFTSALPGHRRDIAPIYSLMIATEPLPAAVFDEIGLRRRETFSDARRLVIYGQRTADDRIAFGGRGAPYHFGSALKPEFERHEAVQAGLHDTLRQLFPQIGDAAITHRWGGAVAAPRDWYCSVGYDHRTGIGWAGGYVGDGVATTNLAGRTLTDLVLRRDTDLTTLPWVGHRSRRWEPEPLRWLGINAMVRLPVGADRYEERTRRPERWRSRIMARVIGH